MTPDEALPLLKAIIAREKQDGCPMATEPLIEPAMRRWHSYERRFKQHKNKSLEHRGRDLAKGLIEWHTRDGNYGYDPLCIRHLAESFAEVLFRGVIPVCGSAHGTTQSKSNDAPGGDVEPA